MEDLHVAAVHNHDRYDAEKMDAGKKISGWGTFEVLPSPYAVSYLESQL
jgi:hypothetical protein